ncbi:MAG: hypothetical protein ACOH2F_14945 [Cellulomonas sp.]
MDNVDDRIALAPLPTVRTVRRRKSLPVQLVRFALINLRMIAMVRRGHH